MSGLTSKISVEEELKRNTEKAIIFLTNILNDLKGGRLQTESIFVEGEIDIPDLTKDYLLVEPDLKAMNIEMRLIK